MFVGRDSELNLLTELRRAAERGQGSIALVSGAATSGKTSLLYAFAETGIAEGALYLGAAGSRAERNLPLGVLRQLLQAAGLVPGHTDWATRMLDRISALPERYDLYREHIDLEAALLMQEACATLLEASNKQPLLIGVDDLQDVDVPSLQCLLFLIRRLRSARVMVVLNELSSIQPGHPQFRAELFRQPNCQPIRLPLLTKKGVGQMLTNSLGLPAARRLMAGAHQASGGNPLLARALVEDQRLADRTDGEVALHVGATYAEAVVSCLYRHESSTPRVAHAVAVLDRWATSSRVALLSDTEPQAAERVIAALTDCGILLDGRFRHPAARRAVLDSIVVEDSAAFHLSAAKALYQDGACAATVADCLLEGQVCDPWGVPVLREAARQALAKGEPAVGRDYLKLAYDACPDELAGAELLVLLAEAEWRLSPDVALRYLPELLICAEKGLLTERQAELPIRILLWYGQSEQASELLGRYLAADPQESEPSEVHAAQLELSSWYPQFLNQVPETPGRPRACATSNLRHQAARLYSAVLRRAVHGELGTNADSILQRHGVGEAPMEPKSTALRALLSAGRPAAVSAWCEPLLKELGNRREPTWQATLYGLAAEAAARQGRLTQAVDQARKALDLLPRHGWGVAVGGPVSALVLGLTGLGRLDEAAKEVGRPVPEAMFDTPFGMCYLHARGHFHLAMGQPQAALADFQTCGELMTRWGLELPALAPWQIDVARAQIALGQDVAARRRLEEQLGRLGAQDTRARGVCLRLLAAVGNIRNRPQMLREAVELLQKSGDQLELVHALSDLSRAHHTLGEMTRAKVIGRRAHLLAEKCGIRPSAWAPTPDGGPAGARPAGDRDEPAGPDTDAVLSDAEQRVAQLAARGHTNREISRLLHITVSTVEQHLTRVYRKLQVRRREDLSEKIELGLVEAG